MSLSAIPAYGMPIDTKGVINRTWYQFWTDIWKGKPQGGIATQLVTASPFTYQALTKGFMVVQGGTVSLIQFSRDGITNVTTGQTFGCIPLAQGDLVIITYSVAPTITWVPL